MTVEMKTREPEEQKISEKDTVVQIGQPKITVIYDNRTDDASLTEGFGFSCLIEWMGRTILFDTGGQRDAFFNNIQKQKIALDTISHVVFSHEHWDHTTAFEEILGKLKEKTPVYLPAVFSTDLLKKVPSKLQVKTNDAFSQIDENIYSLTLVGKFFCGLISIQEQSLVFDTPKGLIILTGCAHPGIITIIEAVQAKFPKKNIHLVMGGFHLHHSFSCTVSKVVKKLGDLKVEKVAPCHCAGDKAIKEFKASFGDNFIKVGTGTVL